MIKEKSKSNDIDKQLEDLEKNIDMDDVMEDENLSNLADEDDAMADDEMDVFSDPIHQADTMHCVTVIENEIEVISKKKGWASTMDPDHADTSVILLNNRKMTLSSDITSGNISEKQYIETVKKEIAIINECLASTK